MAATAQMTILNVDDNEIALYTKSRILRRADYHVLEAQTGQEALELVETAKPQLVLLDIKLPDMHGFEVCRRIKASHAATPIMVLHISANYSDTAVRTRALEGGADAYITEPIEAEELLANVNALLRLWRAEATIRESEARWALAVQATGDAIWDCDLTTGQMWWNEAYQQRFGQWPLEQQNFWQWWINHIHPADQIQVVSSLKTALEGDGITWSAEYRYRCPTGAYAEILDRVSITRDEQGVATRILGAILDLSERKQVERQLAYHANLLENMHDAVLATDMNFIVTVWNRGAEQLYGWSASEVVGHYLLDVLRYDLSKESETEGLAALKTTGRYRTELNIRHKNGTYVYTESITVALYDENKQTTGYMSINRDISERKRYEAELKALNATLEQRVIERTEELERSNRELDSFAYVASHDLRSPLRAIDNLAKWIDEDAGPLLPHPSQVHLQKLQGRVQRMEKLLEDLLAYSRAGRYHYATEKINAADLIANILKLLNVPPDFTITVQADIPAFETLRVPLELVLRNLIDNALKHHDRPDGHIEIKARDCDTFIEFWVKDDGPGIDPQYHERIFQIFQTLKPRDQVEGSGMGLAVVKKTIESRGGTIQVLSSVGAGATFVFTWLKVSSRT